MSGLLSFTLSESSVQGAAESGCFYPLIRVKDVLAATISRWISSVVKLAYMDLSYHNLSLLWIRRMRLEPCLSWAF